MAMTVEQFEVVGKLLRVRPQYKARDAARLVVVQGCTLKEASEKTGVSYVATSAAVQRFRRADEEIRKAYKVKKA